MLVNVIAELESRGVQAPGGLSRTDWLRMHDPSLSAAAARAFVTVGTALSQPTWARLRMLVATQQVTVGNAAQIVRFEDQARPVADLEELAAALDDITGQATVLRTEEFRHPDPPPQRAGQATTGRRRPGRRPAPGPRAVVRPAQPVRHGLDARRARPRSGSDHHVGRRPAQHPCPGKDKHGTTIAPDPRTPAKRRADALVEIVARGVSAPEGTPTTDKTKVVVLIDLETLVGDLRGTGTTLSGDVLTPETVRRLACDAGIIPMVLGRQGEPLDVGRQKRLVTRGLRLALIARDKGCSFPGCTMPPQWADAHHVLPWYRGGRTSLLTTALLCRRHHTHVHRKDLTATVTATAVTWHV